MAFLNATSQFRKIVGKMVSYFEDEFRAPQKYGGRPSKWWFPLKRR